LHGLLQRPRWGVDLWFPEPAAASARLDRIHRAFGQRVRCPRPQRSALPLCLRHFARVRARDTVADYTTTRSNGRK
jgi:hypothetical protein